MIETLTETFLDDEDDICCDLVAHNLDGIEVQNYLSWTDGKAVYDHIHRLASIKDSQALAKERKIDKSTK